MNFLRNYDILVVSLLLLQYNHCSIVVDSFHTASTNPPSYSSLSRSFVTDTYSNKGFKKQHLKFWLFERKQESASTPPPTYPLSRRVRKTLIEKATSFDAAFETGGFWVLRFAFIITFYALRMNIC